MDKLDYLATGAKIFFLDNFFTGDHLTTAVIGTALVTVAPHSVQLSTGSGGGSAASVTYKQQAYNPLYSTVRVTLRLSDPANTTFFVGFHNVDLFLDWDPELDWTAYSPFSSYGFLLEAGQLYLYTTNGDLDNFDGSAVPISGVDLTRELVFEIACPRGRTYFLPYTVPYFDYNALPELQQGLTRKWSEYAGPSGLLPLDGAHYLSVYVRSATSGDKLAYISKVVYKEIYPD